MLCKKVPCLKNLQIVFFVTNSNISGRCCQRSEFFVTNAVKWSNFFLRRKGKALCERPFALHRQQPEKYKENVDVSLPGKISAGAHGKGAGAILTKVC